MNDMSDVWDLVDLSATRFQHVRVPHLLLAIRQLVARDVISLCICANRCDSAISNEDVFIVLSTPSLVVDVKQWLLALGFDLKFDDSGAPNMFGVKDVYLVASFNVGDSVLLLPDLVVFDPF